MFDSFTDDRELWLLRVVWLLLPLLTGATFGAALDDAGDGYRIGSSILLWLVWALMALALMVPRTETLTALRIAGPAAPALFLLAAIDADDVSAAWVVVGAVACAVVLLLALRATVADRFVDGSSYGDETRFLLRTPGPLLVGPLALVWLLTVVGATLGPVLLLSERWVLGAVAVVIGAPIVWFGIQAIHRLSHRWLVFVPAGLVVHDKTALREPQLFRTEDIARFGAAPADTTVEDISLQSPGLALRAELTGPSKIIRNGRDHGVDLTDIDGFIVTPNRPGAVLDEAKRRGIPIG